MTEEEIKKVAKATADEVFHQAWKATLVGLALWAIVRLAEVWLTH